MQSLNSTVFRIIAVPLGAEIMNLLFIYFFFFFTQFECVCILMSTLTHSGIVQVKRSPPPPTPKMPVHQCALICFYPQWKRNVYNLNGKLRERALHAVFVVVVVFFFLRWLKTHVQLIVITSQNLLDCA